MVAVMESVESRSLNDKKRGPLVAPNRLKLRNKIRVQTQTLWHDSVAEADLTPDETLKFSLAVYCSTRFIFSRQCASALKIPPK